MAARTPRKTKSKPKAKGRPLRVGGLWSAPVPAKRLIDLEDHGEPRSFGPDTFGIAQTRRADDSWIEPFLDANRQALERLGLETSLTAGRDGARLSLTPGSRVGAVALRSPQTRRVVAGLLVRSRYGWSRVGQVLDATRFTVEPALGGGPLVPGSAREVPPWLLAGPVLSRLAALLEHVRRGFVLVTEDRTRPRGHVDWNAYARRSLPTAQWQRFSCTYPDLLDDPELLAAARWTLRRLVQDLERSDESLVARSLLATAHELLSLVGPGRERRPDERLTTHLDDLNDYLRAAVEGMCWVADERGLGGSKELDGLPWSLDVAALWEAWVESVAGDLASRLGARLTRARLGETARPLEWHTPLRTMTHLLPDLLLTTPDRAICIDAKYKRHLDQFRTTGWDRASPRTRDAHRADLHQALAYAAAIPAQSVDTVLAYPVSTTTTPPLALAELSSGPRRLRLLLAGLPFGYATPDARDAVLSAWEGALRAP